MLEIYLLLFLTFLLRVIPRLIFKLPINSDTWFHLTYAEEIRQNNRKVPSRFKKYLLNNEVVYPYLYHLIIGLTSFKNNIKYEKYYSAFVDTLFVFASYWATIFITGDERVALTVSVLLAVSATLLKVSTGPRAYQGTPRVLGELLVFCSLISLYYFWQSSNYLWLVASILLGSLSLICSKFSFQALVLFLPTIALFTDSVMPIVLLFFILIFAIIATKDKYIVILIGHYNHLFNYATVLKKQWKPINELNKLAQYVQFIKKLFSLDFLGALKLVDGKLLYLNITYKAPEIYIFAVYLISYGVTDDFDEFLLGWSLSGLIFFFVVSTHSFKFIGEAERYIEYAIYPLVLLIAMHSSEEVLIYLIIFFVCLYFLNLYKLKKSISGETGFHDNLNKVCEFLKKNFDASNSLVPIISKTTFHQGALLTGMNILATTQYDRKKFGEDQWDKLYELGFPLFTNDFKWLSENYGVTMILAYKPFIWQVQEEGNFRYEFDGYNDVYNENNFIVYEKI
jgi:hypothetical protein